MTAAVVTAAVDAERTLEADWVAALETTATVAEAATCVQVAESFAVCLLDLVADLDLAVAATWVALATQQVAVDAAAMTADF